MSCASEGGRPRRTRTMTEKGKQYSLSLLYVEAKRIVKRLANQKSLFENLLKSKNVEMVDREISKLDSIHQELLETYAQVREIVQTEEDSSEVSENLQNLVKVVDEEDTAVFQVKKAVSVWMIEQTEEAERRSQASSRSGYSKKKHTV